jgi:hypothetical protein
MTQEQFDELVYIISLIDLERDLMKVGEQCPFLL